MISNLHLRHTIWHSSNRNGMRRDTCLLPSGQDEGKAVSQKQNEYPAAARQCCHSWEEQDPKSTRSIYWWDPMIQYKSIICLSTMIMVWKKWNTYLHTHQHVLCTQTILTWESLSVVWPGGHRHRQCGSVYCNTPTKWFLASLFSSCW